MVNLKPNTRTVAIAAVIVVAFGPAQAAAALCDLPSAGSAIPTGITILQGALVLTGMVVASTGGGGGGGGDYGTSSKRKAMAAGIAVIIVGALLPQLMGYILNLIGSSPADVGLSCAL